MKEEKIRAVIILEVVGKPAEYIEEALKDLIKQVGEEKNIKLIEAKANEPCELKEPAGFYTSFAEIEIEAENLLVLSGIIFKYMPAHLEIIKPESIFSTNSEWNTLFNELIRRLHGYDEVTRISEMEKKILENKLREVLANTEKSVQVKENTKKENKDKSRKK